MKLYKEESLNSFAFWGGAKDTAKYLTEDEMDIIEYILAEQYPDGIYETDLNDIFWFNYDLVAELLGYEGFEAIMSRYDDEDED